MQARDNIAEVYRGWVGGELTMKQQRGFVPAWSGEFVEMFGKVCTNSVPTHTSMSSCLALLALKTADHHA